MTRLRLFALLCSLVFLTGQDYGSGMPMVMASVSVSGGISSILFSGTGDTNINVPSTKYTPISGSEGLTSTLAESECVVTTYGILTDLQAEATADIGGAGDTLTVTLMVNGSPDTSLECLITGDVGATVCDGGKDTTEVDMEPGDLVAWKAVVAGAPVSNIRVGWSARFQADSGNESLLCSNFDPADSGTSYGALNGNNVGEETAIENGETMIALDGTVGPHRLTLTTAPGSGNSRTFEMLHDGSVFSPTITTTFSNAETSKTVAQTGSVTAGEKVTWRATETVTPAATRVKAGSTFTADTNGFNISSLTQGNKHVAGQRFVLTSSSADPAFWTAEATAEIITSAFTATAMFCELSLDPGDAADQFTIYLRNDGGASGLACVVNGTAPFTDSDTGTDTIADGTEVVLRYLPADSPTGLGGASLVGIAASIP